MIINRKQSRQQYRAEQRVEKKRIKRQENAESEVASQIKKLFQSILSKENLNEIAKNTGLITRQREISANALIAVLMLGCSGERNISSLETISSYLNKWFNISMRPQSVQSRLNRKECAAFMKEVATRVMIHEANKIMDKLLKKSAKCNSKYSFYKRILLQDSTVISLPESVARIFRGCGGSASKAAVKCDVIIDQVSHLIIRIKCVAGKIPDSSLSGDIIEHLREGDLVIRDLGYFNLDHFSTMIQKDIKFISRLSKNVHIYLIKDEKTHLDIIEYLEKLGISNGGIDIEVFVGKKMRIPMRLIGIKVPAEVREIRRERHKRVRKNEPSEDLHEWNGYTMMLTNIPKDELSLQQILKMYKIRWQIELFFKNVKSYLHIDKLTGKNKYRILTLIYTKLILTWMASLLYAYAQMIAKSKEVSKFKFTRWLQEEFGWRESFITTDFTKLFEALHRDLAFLCKKSAKKQRSMLDNIPHREEEYKIAI